MHAWPQYVQLSLLARYGMGLAGLFGAGAGVAVAEGILVKLYWRRVPNFIMFGTALSLLAALVAAARG